jgi:ubiquinone/menaquinone biosynthesis C-methylase UbiE
MGCMAMNWALRGARITAVDLNPTAVAQTRRRFLQRGLPVRLCETDAESLPFPSSHFDHAYSWGVLHHTPGIQRAIDELYRVLKPGGTIGVMLYYRHSFLHQYVIRFVEGYLHAEREFLTPPQLSSRYGDGARLEGNPHTVPVTRAEVHEVLFRRFEQVRTEVFGTDVASILDQWLPGFGSRVLPRPLLDACARRWGWSLWIEAVKPQR